MEANLIAEVAKWPVLYDTSLQEYKHVELKNYAWQQIAHALFQSSNQEIVDNVKSKWKYLRDTFVKSIRRTNKVNGKPWKLESEMAFLKPYISPKLSLTNRELHFPYGRMSPLSPSEEFIKNNGTNEAAKVKEEDTMLKRDICNNTSLSDMDGNIHSVMQHVETVMEKVPVQRKKKAKRESFTPESIHHFLDISHQTDYHEQPQPPYDAVDSYFLGIAQTVKTLKPRSQVTIKKALSNLVFDAELKETEGLHCKCSSS